MSIYSETSKFVIQNGICFTKDFINSPSKFLFDNSRNSNKSMIENFEWKQGFVNFKEVEKVMKISAIRSQFLHLMHENNIQDWYFVELEWNTHDNTTSEKYLPIKID